MAGWRNEDEDNWVLRSDWISTWIRCVESHDNSHIQSLGRLLYSPHPFNWRNKMVGRGVGFSCEPWYHLCPAYHWWQRIWCSALYGSVTWHENSQTSPRYYRKIYFIISNEIIHQKGIDVGDVGPKYGYNSKDNGFLILNSVIKAFHLK